MHEHKDTCIKYIVGNILRYAKHCRFHLCHNVMLWLLDQDDAPGKPEREITFARTGQDLVLPREPREPEHDLCPVDALGAPVPPRPTHQLGPTMITGRRAS